MDWLNGLLNNHTVALIGAPLLIVILVVALVQNWRAVRRGDPIKRVFLRPMYPDNPMYKFYLIQLWGVTAAALFVVAPIALLVLVALILQYFHI